jgi:hypothetical protein
MVLASYHNSILVCNVLAQSAKSDACCFQSNDLDIDDGGGEGKGLN